MYKFGKQTNSQSFMSTLLCWSRSEYIIQCALKILVVYPDMWLVGLSRPDLTISVYAPRPYNKSPLSEFNLMLFASTRNAVVYTRLMFRQALISRSYFIAVHTKLKDPALLWSHVWILKSPLILFLRWYW